jgi:DNA polymerase-3 subunit beta
LEFVGGVVSDENVSCAGVRIEKEGNKLFFIATDTFRMLKKETTSNAEIYPVTIPKKACDVIKKILKAEKHEKLLCSTTKEGNATFCFDETNFSTRTITTAFPKWQSIFGNYVPVFKVSFEKEPFQKTLEKLIYITSNATQRHAVTLIFSKGKLEIQGFSETRKTKEKLLILTDYQEGFKISLNAKFILDYVKNKKSDFVEISFVSETSPIMVDDCLLLMPIALSR